MGKFAGFFKRVKNFGNNILNGMINGMSKLNNVYKKMKPTLKPIIDTALSFVPLGGLIGYGVEKGFDKISNLIDIGKFGVDNPNVFLPSYNKNDFINNNIKLINIDNKNNKNNNNNEKIRSRFNELKRINTNN